MEEWIEADPRRVTPPVPKGPRTHRKTRSYGGVSLGASSVIDFSHHEPLIHLASPQTTRSSSRSSSPAIHGINTQDVSERRPGHWSRRALQNRMNTIAEYMPFAPFKRKTLQRPGVLAWERLNALDILRGVAILMMVFCCTLGWQGKFQWVGYATWDGLYLGDITHGIFVFCAGCAMAFSFNGVGDKEKWVAALYHSLKRTILLFLIGMIMRTFMQDGFPINLANIIIPSVLGRIALAYFTVSIALLFLPRAPFLRVPEITEWAAQWAFIAILQIVYLTIVFDSHVPGCPTGYLGMGGDYDGGKYQNCTGGATGHADRNVFGVHHLTATLSCSKRYNCHGFDDEGILGMVPATLHVWLGFTVGQIFISYTDAQSRLIRLVIYAVIEGLLAVLLHYTCIPINRNLWSISFVLATSSISMLFLALVDYFMNFRFINWRGGALRAMGRNPLVLYIISQSLIPLLKSFYVDHPARNLWDEYIWGDVFARPGRDSVSWALWGTFMIFFTILVSEFVDRNFKILKL